MTHHEKPKSSRYALGLALGALGIVYGDIGTSPLYAMRECFTGEHGIAPTAANVLGVLSLIFWTIIIVVSIKYCIYVLRADNRGEGGILALMALVRPVVEGRLQWILIALALFGAALLYGDGVITPAISVLSAVEGLDIATPFFKPYVVPITIGVLIVLFFFQRHGTGGIGKVFGPVMLLWFVTLAVLGVRGILQHPTVLAAINPAHAVQFFARNGMEGFLTLGAVVLVATGGEALYADMGHFGRRPIRIDWFTMVAPALLLNYFGQGALLIDEPEAAVSPFFHLVPSWGLYPMVVLSTVAAVIASQAMISGAFSLTRQAVQLGYLPRMEIIHTSSAEIGQIYIPGVNWAMMLGTIGLVLSFRTSTNLAGAYGIAVTGTMIITTLLAYFVTHRLWHWPRALSILVTVSLLIADCAFFAANTVKIPDGGWFPLVAGLLVYILMSTWKKGRGILADRLREGSVPFETFVESVRPDSPTRVPGTAIFMARDAQGTPTALLHNLKHNKVLHSKVILLTVVTEEFPTVSPEERIEIHPMGKEFYRVIAHYGFTQDPGVPDVLERLREKGLDLDLMSTTFFLSRETLLPSKRPGMAIWREKLFALMTRNALRSTQFFQIPVNRVVELGMQVQL